MTLYKLHFTQIGVFILPYWRSFLVQQMVFNAETQSADSKCQWSVHLHMGHQYHPCPHRLQVPLLKRRDRKIKGQRSENTGVKQCDRPVALRNSQQQWQPVQDLHKIIADPGMQQKGAHEAPLLRKYRQLMTFGGRVSFL